MSVGPRVDVGRCEHANQQHWQRRVNTHFACCPIPNCGRRSSRRAATEHIAAAAKHAICRESDPANNEYVHKRRPDCPVLFSFTRVHRRKDHENSHRGDDNHAHQPQPKRLRQIFLSFSRVDAAIRRRPHRKRLCAANKILTCLSHKTSPRPSLIPAPAPAPSASPHGLHLHQSLCVPSLPQHAATWSPSPALPAAS